MSCLSAVAVASSASSVLANGSPTPVAAVVAKKGASAARIADKIAQCEREGKLFFSFEYFPPKTDTGVSNLYERVERMAAYEPLFCDMTWGAGGSTSDLTLELVGNIQQFLGLDVMMHLTCTNMPAGKVVMGLEGAKARGCRNILALRGDPPAGKEWSKCDDGFEHATDLVRFIREKFGDYFSIGVAGYPEGHPSGYLDGKLTLEQEMAFLKDKVDAGADFIITQMFYDVENFLQWVSSCRAAGINVPILPGILPIQNYGGFKRMTGFCKTMIPPAVEARMEELKDDEAAVKEYGITLGVEMCKRMIASKLVLGLHFYTLNLEKSVLSIVERLHLVPMTEAIRALPWRPSTASEKRRGTEDVRPIFWSNRPKSYIKRTSEWDNFPNGRWGVSESPAFGDISHHHLAGSGGVTPELKQAQLQMWGEPRSVADVEEVFVRFLEGNIKRLPWTESDVLSPETGTIQGPLKWLNKHGVLTINSQPRVNGAPSSDKCFGWGDKHGFVYQKAYLEFFASEKIVDALFAHASAFPSLSMYAARADLSAPIRSNVSDTRSSRANAVTWGVFPDAELVQPTVVDPTAFKAWREEAFDIWTQVWASCTPDSSPARQVLQQIHDTYYLINIVDNDYVAGDIFRIFTSIFSEL
ncbi:Methylenetetrahydrofolate reductase 1 [Porphyridium purpureum]|uniref:Methylenetetrahydrofolate reductase 1 n=1 Tax=Porphyridium purpureum TaxID=35688 RepID=A0A5J4YRE4_PORPP|nr:Methylenetetrahydrofolate reductase 1 [Porphyridium purpureum]|eukprot:POR5746..scf236_6